VLNADPAGAVEVAAHAAHPPAAATTDAPAPAPPATTDDLRGAVNAYEKALLEDALARHRYNQRSTAAALGLSYDQLRHAMKRHQLALSSPS
jgi:psp operon transcriptional activator